jgi:hypothetical protein
VPLCPPQTPHAARTRTRVAAVGSERLTAELRHGPPGRFTLGERAHGTHWIRGWVGPRENLDDVEKRKFLILLELEIRTLGRSQSLH